MAKSNVPWHTHLYRAYRSFLGDRRYAPFRAPVAPYVTLSKNNEPEPGASRLPRAIGLISPVSEVKRILIIKLDHIGDFVTALPAVRIIRAHFPEASMELVCLPMIVPLAERTGMFSAVYPLAAHKPSDQITGNGEPLGDLELGDWAQRPFDLAVDLRHDVDTRFYLNKVRARWRAGFLGDPTVALDIALPSMEWDGKMREALPANPPPQAGHRLTLLATQITLRFGDEDLPPLSGKRSLRIGIGVGAGSPTRRWPTSYWIRLINDWPDERPVEFLFYGGEGDRQVVESIIAGCSGRVFRNRIGEVPLPELAAEFLTLDIYFGMDTGLTHLAAELPIRSFCLFAGVSTLSVWGAAGAHCEVLYVPLSCAPCRLRDLSLCRHEHACMVGLRPEFVLDRVARRLRAALG